MNRLLVALLAAFDAVMAVAVGIAAALAPLTLLWVFGFGGGDAPWAALWPTTVTVWQAGHLVPVQVEIGAEYATIVGIPSDATSFVFSLAPLAFALFTAVFAVRSGARGARAGAWVEAVAAGTVTVAVLALAVASTSALEGARVETWQAVLLPSLVFGLPALVGALVSAWREGDDGPLDRLREWMDLGPGIVEAGARGVAAVGVGFVGVGAAVLAAGVLVGAGQIVALFEAAHVDLVGVITVSLGQLLYLPTLVGWAAAYAAGPGFALGIGTAVSPGGTQVGVLPGIPALAVVPENPSPWLLLLALLVVGVGALAGWIARARLQEETGDEEPLAARAVILAIIIGGAAATAAIVALVTSGAIGPGRLQDAGPHPGVLALVVAIEVAVGAAAVLLAPGSEAGLPAAEAGLPPAEERD